MAYRLKTIQYKNRHCAILLQNENGPCPLLAAANALLLRGVCTLPATSRHHGVASLQDVNNMLVEQALLVTTPRTTTSASLSPSSTTLLNPAQAQVDIASDPPSRPLEQQSPVEAHPPPPSEQHDFYVHELVSHLPNFQYGMDVNPQFTRGCTGYEYTAELTALDMLGVPLVHGWLVDPEDQALLARTLGHKSYNQLVERLIHGQEATVELEQIEHIRQSLRRGLLEAEEAPVASSAWPGPNRGEEEEEKQGRPAILSPPATPSSPILPTQDQEEVIDHAAGRKKEEEVDVLALQQQLVALEAKREALMQLTTEASIISDFFEETAHQLTLYGLIQLHQHVQEGELCVFFRNNHFNTLTKHDGLLYLLVTDLGYADTPAVVWEKLDVIDGDTEYVNQWFQTTAPSAVQGPVPPSSAAASADQVLATGVLEPWASTSLSPEQLLANRHQSEADFELALQLSRQSTSGAGPGPVVSGGSTVPPAEAHLPLGLVGTFPDCVIGVGIPITYPPRPGGQKNTAPGSVPEPVGSVPTAAPSTSTLSAASPEMDPYPSGSTDTMDHMLARQMQDDLAGSEDASLQLARQLQEEENQRFAQQQQQQPTASATPNSRPARQPSPAFRRPVAAAESNASGGNCVIS